MCPHTDGDSGQSGVATTWFTCKLLIFLSLWWVDIKMKSGSVFLLNPRPRFLFVLAECQWGHWACISYNSKLKLTFHIIIITTPPFLIGPKLPPLMSIDTHEGLKICKSQQLEPQLILCYEDFKRSPLARHSQQGYIRGRGRRSVSTQMKKRRRKKKLRKNTSEFERIWTLVFCTARFLFFFLFIQNGL